MAASAEELRERLDGQRNDLGADLDAIGDRVSPARIVQRRKSAARNRLHDVRERLMGARDDAATSIAAAPGAVGDRVSQTASQVGEHLAAGPDAARRAAQGNPIAVGLVAFGAGLVIASLLPETEAERAAVAQVQPALEQAAAGTAGVVRDVIDEVRPAVEQAATDLKESAAESAQTVQAQAKEAATDTTDTAREAADDLRPS
jgi:hypothetical protein